MSDYFSGGLMEQGLFSRLSRLIFGEEFLVKDHCFASPFHSFIQLRAPGEHDRMALLLTSMHTIILLGLH